MTCTAGDHWVGFQPSIFIGVRPASVLPVAFHLVSPFAIFHSKNFPFLNCIGLRIFGAVVRFNATNKLKKVMREFFRNFVPLSVRSEQHHSVHNGTVWTQRFPSGALTPPAARSGATVAVGGFSLRNLNLFWDWLFIHFIIYNPVYFTAQHRLHEHKSRHRAKKKPTVFKPCDRGAGQNPAVAAALRPEAIAEGTAWVPPGAIPPPPRSQGRGAPPPPPSPAGVAGGLWLKTGRHQEMPLSRGMISAGS